MIAFDWSRAFSSLIPIGVFCVILFVFYLYGKLLIWIEDRTGIPVMISLLFILLVVVFILGGLEVM